MPGKHLDKLLLSLYADGNRHLPDATVARARTHIAECALCRAEVEELQDTAHAEVDIGDEELGDELVDEAQGLEMARSFRRVTRGLAQQRAGEHADICCAVLEQLPGYQAEGQQGEIVEGKGGEGAAPSRPGVWLVRDTYLDVRRLLVVIPRKVSTSRAVVPDSVDLRQRIRSYQRVCHPHLLTVLLYGETVDSTYYLTEAADDTGEPGSSSYQPRTLRTILGRSRGLDQETLTLISKVASGLVALHGSGLVHGNLGPETVLIVEGEPKIIPAAIVGNWAIEQVAVRQPVEDLAAFARMLSEIAGLSLGRRAERSQEMSAVLQIVARTIDANPARRLKSADEMCQLIERCLSGRRTWWARIWARLKYDRNLRVVLRQWPDLVSATEVG